ncbi:UNVERIFIED_CONTAM: hypothetical protein RMT77_003365 [Armadillidium vulgare]
MGLCCCISLQKGVIIIAVISLLYSAVFVVMNLVTSVTFEEHVRACREDVARDVLKAFPACDLLTDASLLMAGRIFIYIQLLVWITKIITSGLLIFASIKKRTNLMIPWAVVSFLVVLILAWNIYEIALGQNLLHLLLLIATLLIIVYFLIVVRSFGVHIAREFRNYDSHANHIGCHRSSLASQTLPTCYEYFKPSSENREDLPPAYTPFATSKKGPLPSNLGVRY